MIDPALPRGCQPFGDRLCDKVGGAQVQAGDGVVVVLGDVEEGARAIGAGIVDQDVERISHLDRSADGGQVGNVERQRVGVAASFLDRSGGFGDLGGGSSKQGDVGADLGQGRRGSQADAATRSGDQGSPAIKAHGGEAGKDHCGEDSPARTRKQFRSVPRRVRDRCHTGSKSSSFHSSADAPANA